MRAKIPAPRYATRVEVSAIKIKEIVPQVKWSPVPPKEGEPPNPNVPDGALLVAAEDDVSPVRADQEFMEKIKPAVGGYILNPESKDGFIFMPAAEFEAKYHRIS